MISQFIKQSSVRQNCQQNLDTADSFNSQVFTVRRWLTQTSPLNPLSVTNQFTTTAKITVELKFKAGSSHNDVNNLVAIATCLMWL